MSYGVTNNGFVSETYTNLVLDLNNAFQAKLGAGIDVSPQSVYGQIIGIMAERLANIWDGMLGVYGAWNPDSAFGISLDTLCALTGVVRNPASYSTVNLILFGTAGTIIPSGSMVATSTGSVFSTSQTVTIGSLPSWAGSTAYAVGAILNNGSGSIYYCSVAGTSAGVAPSGPGTVIDGSVTWVYVGTSTYAVVVPAQATIIGPVVANPATLTVIQSPVAGWQTVTNPVSALIGSLVESDAALRIRREQDLALGGLSTVNAIRTQVLQIPGVSGCIVFDNPQDTPDGNSVPAHAFETLVIGSPSIPTLLATIWKSKPAGVQAYGQTTGTTPDSAGNTQTVGYTLPTALPVYVAVTVLADQSIWSAANAAGLTLLVQNALLNYGIAALVVDKDVVASALEAQLVYNALTSAGIGGILDATCNIGTAPSPGTRTTVAIGARQFATLALGDITVAINYGVP